MYFFNAPFSNWHLGMYFLIHIPWDGFPDTHPLGLLMRNVTFIVTKLLVLSFCDLLKYLSLLKAKQRKSGFCEPQNIILHFFLNILL